MQAHMSALREAHNPKTRKQARGFIGMYNVFRRFVSDCARLAAPLTDLMGSTAPVLVTPETPAQQKAFELLNVALTTPPVLALPGQGRKYVLDVDACSTQVGAALSTSRKTELGARGPASASCVCDSRSHASNLSGQGSAQ